MSANDFDLNAHMMPRELVNCPVRKKAITAPLMLSLANHEAEAKARADELKRLEAEHAVARILVGIARREAEEAGCFE